MKPSFVGAHILFLLLCGGSALSLASSATVERDPDGSGLLRRHEEEEGKSVADAAVTEGAALRLSPPRGSDATQAQDRALEEAAGEPGPLKVGVEFVYRIDQSESSEIVPELFNSGKKAKYKIKPKRVGASYVAAHMKSMDLDPDCVMTVTGRMINGVKQEYELTGKGKFPQKLQGKFWMRHLEGDSMTIEVTCNEKKAKDHGHFEIDKIAFGYVAEQGGQVQDNIFFNNRKMMRAARRRASICGIDDKKNAICYQGSPEYDHGRAVARLLIQGTSLCTGWLASEINHLITNAHCINSETRALNTDYEFMAEAPTCESGNCQLCWPGTIYDGKLLIRANWNLDYALVKIAGDPGPSTEYGFLEIDNRDAVLDEQIYIPQHAGGDAKELGIESSEIADGGLCHVNSISRPPCTGSGYTDVGYYCDTEGGSSGSPVLSSSSHKVIALHHCASCENRGVPINLICSKICDLLAPECTVDSDCDDADPCTTETCETGTCIPQKIQDCCPNGICEDGEDCISCEDDCIGGMISTAACGNGICETEDGEDCVTCEEDCNGQTSGNAPGGPFCCGGDTPCSYQKCTKAPDWQCTNTPAEQVSYCCGNTVCEWGETSTTCVIDCGAERQACQPIGAPCTVDSDCCSNKCMGPDGAKTCK